MLDSRFTPRSIWGSELPYIDPLNGKFPGTSLLAAGDVYVTHMTVQQSA